jgi:Tap, RNA-binding.
MDFVILPRNLHISLTIYKVACVCLGFLCFIFHLGRGRGGASGHQGGPIYQFKPSNTGWYKCTVVKSSKYEKSYIINLIKDYAKPYEFEYYNFVKIDVDTYSFFVSNFDLAEKLFLSRGK